MEMTGAIYLDNKFQFRAIEINNEIIDRALSQYSEFKISKQS